MRPVWCFSFRSLFNLQGTRPTTAEQSLSYHMSAILSTTFYLFQTFFVDRILLLCAALSDSFVRLPYTESFCNPYFSISQYPDRSITIISCNNFIPYTMYNRIASVSPSIVNYCYLHSRFKVLKYPQHSYSDEGHPVRCCKRLQQRAAGRCKAAEQQRPNYRPEPRSEALRSGRRRRARPLQRCGYVSIL